MIFQTLPHEATGSVTCLVALPNRTMAKNRGLLMLQDATPPRLKPEDLRGRLEGGAVLVDLRDPPTFGAGHVAGSINVWIESPQFAERVGWLAPTDRPFVLLGETEADVARAVSTLARIGLHDVPGYVLGGDAVRASGLPVVKLPNVTPQDLARRLAADPGLLVLDVREPSEWDEGHVPGARHIPMRQVASRTRELPRDRPIAVICRSGPRSGSVASVLLAQGFTDLLNVWGGMVGWTQAGLPVSRG